jgi:cell fate regulator YaaT (PSP1 superfamily)/nitrite reductase/ring-hydroxylating ferredoxin subunit
MTETLQAPGARTWLATTVRYGKMAHTATFKTDRPDLRRFDRCIVRTDRGRELGTVLTVPGPIPETRPPDSLWDVLRKASADDVNNAQRVDLDHRVREMEATKQAVKRLNLSMKIVEVDHLFGGERVVVYFMSEQRVDFRELVRNLAHDFRTRIELRQIGARDQARLVGDVGHCGLDLCCRSHLKELGGITMDMAKVQKHTADPSKITGRCGKLLCCLRYEYTAYTEARELLPPRGTKIQSAKGSGIVVDQNMLLREVTIVKEGTEDRAILKLEEILGMPKSTPGCTGCEKGAAPSETGMAVIEEHPTGRAEVVADSGSIEAPVKPAEFRQVGRIDDLPEGRGRQVDVEGGSIALFNVGGTIHATESRCPHSGGPLGEGEIEGSIVTCPLHQWRFDVASGQCQHLPAVKLKRYDVKIDNGDIWVRF